MKTLLKTLARATKATIVKVTANKLVRDTIISLAGVWMQLGYEHALRMVVINQQGRNKSWLGKVKIMLNKTAFDLFRPLSIAYFFICAAVLGTTITAWMYGICIALVLVTVVFPQTVINEPSAVQHRAQLRMMRAMLNK